MSNKESIVEVTARAWFGELSYVLGHMPYLAPSESATERGSFGEMVLMGRLREAIQRLNPAIPEEALATIRQFRSTHISTGRATNP